MFGLAISEIIKYDRELLFDVKKVEEQLPKFQGEN